MLLDTCWGRPGEMSRPSFMVRSRTGRPSSSARFGHLSGPGPFPSRRHWLPRRPCREVPCHSLQVFLSGLATGRSMRRCHRLHVVWQAARREFRPGEFVVCRPSSCWWGASLHLPLWIAVRWRFCWRLLVLGGLFKKLVSSHLPSGGISLFSRRWHWAICSGKHQGVLWRRGRAFRALPQDPINCSGHGSRQDI